MKDTHLDSFSRLQQAQEETVEPILEQGEWTLVTCPVSGSDLSLRKILELQTGHLS